MHDTRGTCHDHPRVRTMSPITMVAQPNLSSLLRLECRLCRRFRHVMLLTAVNHILQEQFVKLSLHARAVTMPSMLFTALQYIL